MKIIAIGDRVELQCEHCGAVEPVKYQHVSRGFMTQFNRFRRAHSYRCEQITRTRIALEMANAAISRAREIA